jgi:phosphoribosylaminoimidazolecarboxamide formyltransferase/IMP cyclohydrolase
MTTKQRALISVSDKTELVFLAKELLDYDIEILSTGGTLKFLRDAGVAATPVEEVTGFPEILDGRVKTLHPAIHGGLLFRRDKKSHVKEAAKHRIAPIDFVIVNLYPFEKVTGDPSVKFDLAVENIDIGGPSMLRSAAKNFESVTVICDPADYAIVLADMKANRGATSPALRRELARKVFQRTAVYDQAIADFFKSRSDQWDEGWDKDAPLPERMNLSYSKVQDLRYGENPHQRAGFYVPSWKKNEKPFEQLYGKELSYNNFLDIEGAIDVLREFEETAACVVKHSNPCGIAEAKRTCDALYQAIECDSMSAFGGILGVNRPCDLKTAEVAFEKLNFFEVFVAPSFEPAALRFLKARKNLRLIATGSFGDGNPCDMRFLQSGLLVQDRDRPVRLDANLKHTPRFVTQKQLSAGELEDLLFAFKCVKTVKSNAIVITQGRQTVGIGAGQMSRVDSVEIACRKAGYRTDGGFLASDAFFPMPDSIEVARDYKLRAIIQPGGSIRDADVIAACDRFGIAMAFTGQRHFRH